MKRVPELQPLSRDHQPALVLALHARKAASGDPRLSIDQVRSDIQARFPAEIEPHFRIEEDYLLPELERAGETSLAARTRSEHAAIRAAFAALDATPATLARFGELLEQHIRFEERQLFETIQTIIPAAALQQVLHACHAGTSH